MILRPLNIALCLYSKLTDVTKFGAGKSWSVPHCFVPGPLSPLWERVRVRGFSRIGQNDDQAAKLRSPPCSPRPQATCLSNPTQTHHRGWDDSAIEAVAGASPAVKTPHTLGTATQERTRENRAAPLVTKRQIGGTSVARVLAVTHQAGLEGAPRPPGNEDRAWPGLREAKGRPARQARPPPLQRLGRFPARGSLIGLQEEYSSSTSRSPRTSPKSAINLPWRQQRF